MGSLSSVPSVPTTTVVQTAAPAPTTQEQTETVEPSAQEQAAEQRQRNLLSRNRGRLGTIATSFQGFLSENSGGGDARKTLLGE